ncbi:hypothetical protein [Clostridium sp. B9]|uniref:hypothetical protein n=1 Tax=Clostridium sp. B9 TaxID=3423224 RepID=UPI003D2EDAD7
MGHNISSKLGKVGKNRNKTSKVEGEAESDEFKSASVALTTIMDEYTKERERGGIIDNKAVALITILLALVTVYMPIIPFDKIHKIYEASNKNQLIIITIAGLIFLLALIIAIITFIILINIVKLKIYKRVDVDMLIKEEFLKVDKNVYQKALCTHYGKLIIQNSEVNDNKSKNLSICYILTIVLFVLLLISCISMKLL